MEAKMNRRNFFSLSIPATGAVLMAPGFLNFQLLSEINQQFSGGDPFDAYDLVINGAGLSGYFAAIKAARSGMKVLLVDKRPAPGFEITAKRKLWLGAEGLEQFDTELTSLFFPEQENQEIFRKGGRGPNNSQHGDELLLFAGSVKKGLLRNLLLNKVHVLLMTDVCGIFTGKNGVNGALLACKHGLYKVQCSNYIDASDNLLFSRDIFGQPYTIDRAGFVLELLKTNVEKRKVLQVPQTLGIAENKVILHPGKNSDDQSFLEMEFTADSPETADIELQSRMLTLEMGKTLSSLDPSLQNAQIQYYAYESSLILADSALPNPGFDHYHMLPAIQKNLSCTDIIQLKNRAEELVGKIKIRGKNGETTQKLIVAGGEIPFRQIKVSEVDEPGLQVPLKKCDFDTEKYISTEHRARIVVGGGGTSGIFAGIASQEAGADTIVVDYFNDPGGSKTLGGVMGYYHGMKENPFIKEMEKESELYTSELNANSKIKRQLYLWKKLTYAGGKFMPASIIFDTLTENNQVKGITICRNGRLERIVADLTIDATGDGDIASAAGASCKHGDNRTGQTQNYSQWNLTAGGKSPSNPTSDYDIIDNTKISELQRALFLSHYEAHFYDFLPYLTVRESRRVNGRYELNLLDAVEETHFDDIISVATSDFDPHFIDNSEYTRCGFLLPHSNIVKVEIPYRSIVPEKINGLLISGKAFSQTHLALQFTRMSADLSILGYLTGQVSAGIVGQKVNPADFNIKDLQKKWVEAGYLPAEYAGRKPGNRLRDIDEIKNRINKLAQGKEASLYDCCRCPKDLTLPLLKEKFNTTAQKENRLVLAKALAWFGESLGNDLIVEELENLFSEEQKKGYPGGYVEDYDDIRGREENRLVGTFWRINQNIALLGMAGNTHNNMIIQKILENTTSGGDVITRTGDRADYFNSRIDLRIIPFYNRILNLCFYAERIPDQKFVAGFEKLAEDKNIKGWITPEYDNVRWGVYRGYLELYMAASMARCGSKTGYHLLAGYLDDIHYRFKNHASAELKALTGKDFGYDVKSWKNYCNGLAFPQPVMKIVREVEL